jgi:hypothetical protein
MRTLLALLAAALFCAACSTTPPAPPATFTGAAKASGGIIAVGTLAVDEADALVAAPASRLELAARNTARAVRDGRISQAEGHAIRAQLGRARDLLATAVEQARAGNSQQAKYTMAQAVAYIDAAENEVRR